MWPKSLVEAEKRLALFVKLQSPSYQQVCDQGVDKLMADFMIAIFRQLWSGCKGTIIESECREQHVFSAIQGKGVLKADGRL